jgi:hypothetical protein
MRKYIIVMTAVVASLLTIAVLGIVNYYTCFAYYLPHRPTTIEIAPQDRTLEVHPEIIFVPDGFNQTTISLNWTRGAPSNQTIIKMKA